MVCMDFTENSLEQPAEQIQNPSPGARQGAALGYNFLEK